MKTTGTLSSWAAGARWLAFIAVATLSFATGASAAGTDGLPPMYVLDFLGTASDGIAMNDSGQVVGELRIDTGCAWACLAPTMNVVWSGEQALELPNPPGMDTVYLEGINNNGWAIGTAYSQTEVRAVVWKPAGGSYQPIVLGTLPGKSYSNGIGIDNNNRAIGYSSNISPPSGAAFMWTEADGMTDLTTLGFPPDEPRATSPSGTVAYLWGWYQLDVPGVVHQQAPVPDGFWGPGWYTAINDFGDQVRLLGPSNGSGLFYFFRYYNDGTYQQLSQNAGSDGSPFTPGTINNSLDIASTIAAGGYRATGPAGLLEYMTPMLAPSYGDASVARAAAINEGGQILGEVTIGRSSRLMRFVEAEPCAGDCMQVSHMRLQAQFVHDPADPNHCTENAATRAKVKLRVADENGNGLAGVEVTGRFLDDYWMDGVSTRTTNNRGVVKFFHYGTPCVGAIAFLVTDLEKPGRTFDRTSGVLQQWMIPDVPPVE